jgi:DNA polymerase III epsilon subunit-like protein
MTLLSLCDTFGVSFAPSQAHEALADAHATLALYRAICTPRQHAWGTDSEARQLRALGLHQGGTP